MVMDKDFVSYMVSVDVMDSWFHYGPVHRYAVKDKEKDKLRHTVHSLHEYIPCRICHPDIYQCDIISKHEH